MKKVLSAVVVAGAMAGLNAFACGGMTQIKPPGFSQQTGGQTTIDSILKEVGGCLVLC
jgi:hypothetical protein